jgi:peptidoglycan hydrolase-like protein with peptidoglycan-binding domain
VPSQVAKGLLATLGWNRRDAVAVTAGAVATIAFLVNVLYMQSNPNPVTSKSRIATGDKPAATAVTLAPVTGAALRPQPQPVRAVAITQSPLTPVQIAPPPARTATPVSAPPAPVSAPPAARTPGAIILDIQRELARRGFFDGSVDGFQGPKTDRAIRDFERAAGLKMAPEPSENLLQAILRAPARIAKGSGVAPPAARSAAVVNDVAAERPTPSKRVIAMQRVLSEFGYGQIKPTGLIDPETQAAIEKFERERKLPVTGQPSERVMREMTAMTGRPLE